jgi:DNA-directed RNA polymerase specialized sigma subunit
MSDRKEAMKALRAARKPAIERARRRVKEQTKKIKAVKEQIKTEARTIPDIAAALKMPSSETLWYVMTLKKYGMVAEGPQDGDYFTYILTAKEA